MNPHNPVQLKCWRANVDFQPVLGLAKVLSYLSKYVTKAETFSTSFKETVAHLADGLDVSSSGAMIVNRLMLAAVVERDISAQETAHLLLGLPLREASRIWKTVNAYPAQAHFVDLSDEQVGEDDTLLRGSFWEEYQARPPPLEEVCAIEFARDWVRKGGVYSERVRRRPIIQVIPMFVSIPTSERQRELFYYSELKLYKAFRQVEELIGSFPTLEEAYQSFCAATAYSRWHVSKDIIREQKKQPQRESGRKTMDSFNSADNKGTAEREDRLEWQALMHAGVTLGDELLNEHMLGRRDIDTLAQWDRSFDVDTTIDDMGKWVSLQREQNTTDFRKPRVVEMETLNGKQAAACAMVI